MTDKNKKTGMAAFDVLKLSKEGVRVDLTLPDGSETNEFLLVCGADSTEFRCAKAKAARAKMEAIKGGKKKPEDVVQAHAEIDVKLVATLVKAWSFEGECTPETVVGFLKSAPQIQEQVDRFAGNRSNFFEKPPQS